MLPGSAACGAAARGARCVGEAPGRAREACRLAAIRLEASDGARLARSRCGAVVALGTERAAEAAEIASLDALPRRAAEGGALRGRRRCSDGVGAAAVGSWGAAVTSLLSAGRGRRRAEVTEVAARRSTRRAGAALAARPAQPLARVLLVLACWARDAAVRRRPILVLARRARGAVGEIAVCAVRARGALATAKLERVQAVRATHTRKSACQLAVPQRRGGERADKEQPLSHFLEAPQASQLLFIQGRDRERIPAWFGRFPCNLTQVIKFNAYLGTEKFW